MQEPACPSIRDSGLFPESRSMKLSHALAALCGVLLCASGLFAASGESLAPPFGPRPSSARSLGSSQRRPPSTLTVDKLEPSLGEAP